MKTLFAALFLATVAAAEPRVREDQYDVFDIAGMKAGEWIETSDTSEHATADGTKSVTKKMERTACVKSDDEFVWNIFGIVSGVILARIPSLFPVAGSFVVISRNGNRETV